METPRAGAVSIEMYDNAGRLVMVKEVNAHKGSNSFNIELNGLARGVYSVVLKSDLLETKEIKQLIKQ
jgi:hypothetical protein